MGRREEEVEVERVAEMSYDKGCHVLILEDFEEEGVKEKGEKEQERQKKLEH